MGKVIIGLGCIIVLSIVGVFLGVDFSKYPVSLTDVIKCAVGIGIIYSIEEVGEKLTTIQSSLKSLREKK